jgi:hypothetical protein
MTLATHIVIAGAITRPIASAHPLILFAVSLLSHYLADAIPHWDYKIASIDEKAKENVDTLEWQFKDPRFWKDVTRFAFDALVGFGILLFFTHPQTLPEFLKIVLIAAGGVLPDFLQAVYFTRKAEFLKFAQRIHDFFHTNIRLGPYPLIGIPFQALFFLLSLYFLL